MRQLILLLLLTTFAQADIRIPPPTGKKSNLRIVHDAVGKNAAVLDIPASLTDSSIRADIRPNLPIPTGNGGWYDVISGVFLAIGAFFTGRHFWRRLRGPSRILVPAVILVGAHLLFTECSQAQRPTDSNYNGPVIVRILRSGNEVVLHLPPQGAN